MRLVHDHEVPLRGRSGVAASFVSGQKVNGRDEGAFLIACELARLGIKCGPVHEPRVETEFLLEFFLGPLLASNHPV